MVSKPIEENVLKPDPNYEEAPKLTEEEIVDGVHETSELVLPISISPLKADWKPTMNEA